MLPAVRFVRWAVLGAVLLATVVAIVLAGRSPSSPQSISSLFGGGTQDTQWGPLTASDRDMLIKVRQANLWEGPTGEQAAQRAVGPAVREVGRKLGVEHAQLDASLRAVSEQLRLPLPSQPSDQNRVWMAEIDAARGAAYDKTFINIVRSAHGEVMPLVEGVRSGTQNELVRRFAIEASQFIGRHMGYLESTGIVDYALFPPSTAPAARLTSIGGYNVPITLVLFVVAVVVSAALMRGLGRSRKRAAQGSGGQAAGPGVKFGIGRLSAGRLGVGQPGRIDWGTWLGFRRDTAPDTVTTAELIAVLNPDQLTEPAKPRPARGRPKDTRVPAPRRSGPSIPAQRSGPSLTARRRGATDDLERRPPKLRRSSGDRGW